MKDQCHEVHVDDQELYEVPSAQKLLQSKEVIQPTRKSVAALVCELGGNGADDVRRQIIPENPVAQRALEIIFHASHPKRRKNPTMGGKLAGVHYKNPKALLRAAQDYLAQEYGSSFDISGLIVGSDRQWWDKIATPHGVFLAGEWNRTESKEPCGTVRKVREGFKIGDTVSYRDSKSRSLRSGVVVEGSHEHGGLGEGTARIKIRLADGSTEKIPPWLLEKAE
jgi:hypothetical protein